MDERDEISVEMIAECVLKSALHTDGVHAIQAGIADNITGSILKMSGGIPGIRISREDDQVVIDLNIEIEYGVNIPSTAWNVQEHVKRSVEQETGLSVRLVNIHVQKIHFSIE